MNCKWVNKQQQCAGCHPQCWHRGPQVLTIIFPPAKPYLSTALSHFLVPHLGPNSPESHPSRSPNVTKHCHFLSSIQTFFTRAVRASRAPGNQIKSAHCVSADKKRQSKGICTYTGDTERCPMGPKEPTARATCSSTWVLSARCSLGFRQWLSTQRCWAGPWTHTQFLPLFRQPCVETLNPSTTPCTQSAPTSKKGNPSSPPSWVSLQCFCTLLCHLVPETSWNQLESVFLALKPVPHLLIPTAEGFHPLPAGCDTWGTCTVLTPVWQKLTEANRELLRDSKPCVPGLRFVGQFLCAGCWHCSQPQHNTGNSCNVPSKPTCSLTNGASFIFLYRL